MGTKSIGISDLSGQALDWAVAWCEGLVSGDDLDVGFILEGGYSPSTNWAQAGHIIERERMGGTWINENSASSWCFMYPSSYTKKGDNGAEMIIRFGPTSLVAAMRCYVAKRISGEWVAVPDSLALNY